MLQNGAPCKKTPLFRTGAENSDRHLQTASLSQRRQFGYDGPVNKRRSDPPDTKRTEDRKERVKWVFSRIIWASPSD